MSARHITRNDRKGTGVPLSPTQPNSDMKDDQLCILSKMKASIQAVVISVKHDNSIQSLTETNQRSNKDIIFRVSTIPPGC